MRERRRSNITTRTFSGTVLNDKNESVAGVTIVVKYASGEQKTVSDADGKFKFTVPNEELTMHVEGKDLQPLEMIIVPNAISYNFQITVQYALSPVREDIVINAPALDPTVDKGNDIIYKDTLCGRDDQLVQTLSAGFYLANV